MVSLSGQLPIHKAAKQPKEPGLDEQVFVILQASVEPASLTNTVLCTVKHTYPHTLKTWQCRRDLLTEMGSTLRHHLPQKTNGLIGETH